MVVIAWLLIGTVILAYACALIQKYWYVLTMLTEDAVFVVAAIGGVVVLGLILRYLFSLWFERFQVRRDVDRAIRDLGKRTREMDGRLTAAARTIDQNGNPVVPGAALSGGPKVIHPKQQHRRNQKGRQP
jgi:hypothetical protein